ncbi:hypothetical protein ACFDZS_004075 [Salmonella enterica]
MLRISELQRQVVLRYQVDGALFKRRAAGQFDVPLQNHVLLCHQECAEDHAVILTGLRCGHYDQVIYLIPMGF